MRTTVQVSNPASQRPNVRVALERVRVPSLGPGHAEVAGPRGSDRQCFCVRSNCNASWSGHQGLEPLLLYRRAGQRSRKSVQVDNESQMPPLG